MMDLVIPDKTHDESRQGEALVLDPVAGKNIGRKLYIEKLWLRHEFFLTAK